MDENFMSMQQEALRRVQEMQRRSQSYVPPPEPPAEHTGKASPLADLAALNIDEEKALIALLIYILHKNGSDMKLLLGLGYLLL